MECKEFFNNDIKLSYKASGAGQPIILLHGNGESSELFAELAELLAKEGYSVFAPDSRAHGKSDKVKRLFYSDMADDVAALINHEKMEAPILFGFSDGGIIGLLFAIKYPEILKMLLIAGVNLSPNGIKSGTKLIMKAAHFFTRSDKLKLMLTQPNITVKQLQTIKTPTVIFYAENDMVALSDSKTIENNVETSKLCILKDETHDSYIKDNTKLFNLLKDHLKEGTDTVQDL